MKRPALALPLVLAACNPPAATPADPDKAAKTAPPEATEPLAMPASAAPPKSPAMRGPRTAGCRVRSGDWVLVDGPCRFTPEQGGSFTLDRGADAPLSDDILSVSVSIVEPGRAEVRGLTDRGLNARWGEAKRSTDDPACWAGSDFEVCAR